MRKNYYLLKVVSPDLVFDSFEEKYETVDLARKALKAYRNQYHITYAAIRDCLDILVSKRETRPKKRVK